MADHTEDQPVEPTDKQADEQPDEQPDEQTIEHQEKAQFIPEEQLVNDDVDGPPPKRSDRSSSCKILLVLLAILLIIAAFFGGYIVRRHLHGVKCNRPPQPKPYKSYEQLYSSVLNEVSPANLEDQLRYFSSIPHIAGSNESHQQAVYMADHLKKYGFDDVQLKRYSIYLSYPVKPGHASLLDGAGKVLHKSAAREKILDPAENDTRVVSPFNAYSPSGDVKGKLVYANYGHEDDFAYLEKQNISVSGKIVIVRYGKLFRGGKAQNAERRGAKGLIIYSDPADYAYEGVNKTYPDYEWLPEHGVQRGNLWMVKGDPLTPGYPATEGIYRVPKDTLPFPKIPVQPISWADALPLLRTLTKSPSPKAWHGSLPLLQYNIEMDDADKRDVKVEVHNTMEQRPVYNMIASITGSEEPDRYIIIGCHRDAWVFGAVDPSSGTSVIMETARLLGELRKKGWRPTRTIIVASWGAEEHGIMGSGEWVEEFEKTLSSRAVAYINVDGAVAGSHALFAKSSPIMDTVLFQASKKIQSADNKSETLFDDWKRKRPDTEDKQFPEVIPIGAGSDFLFFIQRIGVPCVDIGYRAKKRSYPVYHSVHDTFRWMKKFTDPDFRYHSIIVKLTLRLALDFAGAKVLPFDLNRMSSSLEKYGNDLRKNNDEVLTTKQISLEYVHKAINDFKNASREFMEYLDNMDLNKSLKVRIANDKLIQVERAFINDEGLPGRPAMRHLVFAPSIFDLYTGSKFAGITDSIFLAKKNEKPEDWEQVKKQISMVVHAFRSAATVINTQEDMKDQTV